MEDTRLTIMIGIVGGIVVSTTLLIILCVLCYRKRNRQHTEDEASPYTNPTDTAVSKRSSTYATPYDQFKSDNGFIAVRNISQKKDPQYFNVDVQDGLCERVKPQRKGGGRGHREYFNVQIKGAKKKSKDSGKEYWDVHVNTNAAPPITTGSAATVSAATGSDVTESSGETPENDTAQVRVETRRNNFPTPYSCIELP